MGNSNNCLGYKMLCNSNWIKIAIQTVKSVRRNKHYYQNQEKYCDSNSFHVKWKNKFKYKWKGNLLEKDMRKILLRCASIVLLKPVSYRMVWWLHNETHFIYECKIIQ